MTWQPLPKRPDVRVLFVTLLTLGLTGPAMADDFRARLEITGLGAFNGADSYDAALGVRNSFDALGNVRLMWEPKWNNFDFTFHYVLDAEGGRGVVLNRASTAAGGVVPPATLFDLSHTLLDDGEVRITQKIDRLAIGYSADNFVVRVGRQALTWGAGTVFHPMDLVDPFAPNTVDTEFKPGVDMVYGQVLFGDGSDLQLIAVPRAFTQGGDVAWDASTFAARYATTLGDIGANLIVARDQGDWTAGLGLSGSLGGAVWNAELVPTLEQDGSVKVSGLANISSAITLMNRNATIYAEYYHNGFGVDGSASSLASLPADLSDRLARGQLFTTGRDYVATGFSLEWSPLLTISPSAIVNLNDLSVDLAAEVNWSLADNTNLIFGGQVPVGGAGTAFGGLPVAGSSAPYARPQATAYAQLRQYF